MILLVFKTRLYTFDIQPETPQVKWLYEIHMEDFLTCNSETRLRSRCNKCLICVTAFSFLSSQLGGAAGVVGIAAAELFWPCFWPLDRGKYFSLRNSITRGRFSKNWRNISEGKFQSKSFLIKVHFYQMTQIKCINKATKNPITINFLFFWKKM